MASLKFGSRGSSVRDLQDNLNFLGHKLTSDGIFGVGTMAAVISFQKNHNLKTDGIVGPITSKAIDAAIKSSIETVDEGEHEDRTDVDHPGQGHLWCPFAVRMSKEMTTQGYYPKGYPRGAIVHFTAGRCDSEQDMVSSMEWGRSSGYAFFGIGPTGVIYQAHPLNRWGHHAGRSYWPELGSSVSSKTVGIEIASAGMVDSDNKSWFGQVFASVRVRLASNKDNVIGGRYVKFTEAQEKSLFDLLRWLASNDPEGVFAFDFVLGHDEVSPGRKNDPGGALSMTMTELRKRLL